jgi:hypothetical protein
MNELPHFHKIINAKIPPRPIKGRIPRWGFQLLRSAEIAPIRKPAIMTPKIDGPNAGLTVSA